MTLLTGEGWLFLLRWFHFLAGITWIGLLYYFNLVQTPFFAETEAPVRSGAIQKLVPRALWWFRWGAMFTLITGWLIILHRLGQLGWSGWWNSSYGWTITLGGILGSLMWANVWFVIWPNQKVVIANAVQTAKGGPAIADAAARGRRAALASRTNVVFSIPMLFYMGAASHLNLVRPGSGGKAWMAILSALVIVLVEVNALVGAQGATKKPLDTIQGTLAAGFILALVYYLMFEILLRTM
ncbi:MAG: urate hydroxylase PuuD [Candidatus Rokubacteria bacterium]|nr:urate hydroxylase PuuD [Candidatus Rokubacteria bacterium]